VRQRYMKVIVILDGFHIVEAGELVSIFVALGSQYCKNKIKNSSNFFRLAKFQYSFAFAPPLVVYKH
jgi:hypothetical protein